MSAIRTTPASRPVIAVVCCGGSLFGRDMQFIANRFLSPLAESGMTALLVPTMPSVVDSVAIASRCDGALLTGSNTNVSPARYGIEADEIDADHGRDEVALAVAAAMISSSKPVLGICRGMQELNVLHGGTLAVLDDSAHVHMAAGDWTDRHVFDHSHDINILGRHLRSLSDDRVVPVASVHRQGIARLGAGLEAEATAPDGVVEAVSAERGRVIGVQWHPELMRSDLDRAIFRNLARAA